MIKLSYASAITGIEVKELVSLVKKDQLKAYREGDSVFIETEGLEKYLIESGRDVPEQIKSCNLRLLIVDDDINMVKSLYRLFSRFSSLIIDTAVNGLEMGYRLNSIKPDIIILDYNMPGLNAKKIIAEMSKDRFFDKIKIIVYTGGDPESITDDFKAYSNIIILPKSSDFLRLLQKVEEMLACR